MTSLRQNPWAALGVLSLGLFMTLLDLTIVNIAIPSLVDGLHASLDQVLWVLNAYSLVYAVLLITSARLGDLLGPRNLFAAGLALFTVASALSGAAGSPEQLIAARALQGLGAAIAAPQALPIMLATFPAERRGGVFAVYGMLAGVAVLAGPTLGGFLVTHFGWRSVFFVNLPIGVATVALAFALVPDLRPGRAHRLDLAGVGLGTLGLLLVVFGLIEGQRYDWGTITGIVSIPLVLGAGVVVLLLFVVLQARRQGAEPLVPFAVFADRNFTLMALVLAAMGFAVLGLFLPLTVYFQSVLGLSAVDAGLTLAPQPLTMMFASGLAAALVARISGKYVLIAGLLVFAAAMTWIALDVRADSGRWSFTVPLVLAGLGLGFVWTPVFSLATRDLPASLGGVASGVANTVQEMGGVLAGGVVGALLQNRLASSLAAHGAAAAARGGLEVGAHQASGGSLVFAHAFTDAMRVTLVVPIGVVVLAAVLTVGARRAGRFLEQPADVAA